jgi:outer membrane protein TolC
MASLVVVVIVAHSMWGMVVEQGVKRRVEALRKAGEPILPEDFTPPVVPDADNAAIDIEAAVRRALAERTDLYIAKKNIEANDVTLKYLVDQMRPQVDLSSTYGLVGLGGSQYTYDTSQVGGTVNKIPTGIVPGGYGDAIDSLFRSQYPRWTVAVNISSNRRRR